VPRHTISKPAAVTSPKPNPDDDERPEVGGNHTGSVINEHATLIDHTIEYCHRELVCPAGKRTHVRHMRQLVRDANVSELS
jgi:hypothetical protein